MIDAVRVPPSAWITSQSILIWRSPKPARSVTARSLAVGPGRGGPRQHAVFRRHPALAGFAQPRWDVFLDRGGAENMGVAEARQAGALGMLVDVGFKGNRAQLVGGAAGGTHGLTSQGV